MFSTFDLCLLLYVIRHAGWLKHCNLFNVSLQCHNKCCILFDITAELIGAYVYTLLTLKASPLLQFHRLTVTSKQSLLVYLSLSPLQIA